MYDWVIELIDWGGYLGIFLLMLLETVFPPIPSELILTLAGIRAAQGPLGLPGVIAFATAGAMLGNFLWYQLARSVKPERFRYFIERHGRWVAMDLRDLDKMQRQFERYGAAIVMVGRVLPALRTFISVPPGLLRMPVGRYLLWSTIGTATFSTILALAGYALGLSFERVEEVIAPLALVMVGGGLLWYVWRQITWNRRDHS
ncbi:MAG TPA: DedA family protein [Allosphingosinicella sp.]|nr:DedA family protein [Allosphingosinicella sp.]